jgi:putative membrane protein
MTEPKAIGPAAPRTGGFKARHAWLLGIGVCLFAAIVVANDTRAVVATLLEVKGAALAVVAAHLPVTFAAALGWSALLTASQRPTVAATFRMRLIKEAVNALLPVAQVGGDVVRARLAVTPALPLRTAAASCIVDAALGVACLVLFVLIGLAAASLIVADPRIDHLAIQIAIAGALATLGLIAGERLGFLRLLDRATARTSGALGRLSGVGEDVRIICSRGGPMARSMAWHLLSWSLGVVETWVAMWAVGLDPSWRDALVLESMAQGARALGFAIPGALGVQEGGYVLICSALGIPPHDALALSLLRRLRELTLGVLGLGLWRFEAPPLPNENDPS